MEKIREHFGQVLPLGTQFQHPTPTALAQGLSCPAADELWTPLVWSQPRGDALPLGCLPGGYKRAVCPCVGGATWGAPSA